VNLASRIIRHLRLSWKALAVGGPPSPPFLILYINSICNLRCEHCYNWKNLNKVDDLTFDEIKKLSEELGHIENLYLSGGEPFLRKEFAEVCRTFIRNNGVKRIYVPSNGYFADKTVAAIEEVLKEPDLVLFAIELSLDGMADYHNHMRGSKDSFEKAMETYDALVPIRKKDRRFEIHSASTVNAENLEDVRTLTNYLFERCPEMEHHNIALLRGDPRNPKMREPDLAEYERLTAEVARLWAGREEGRTGGIVEPMIQWTKVRTSRESRQVVPCTAGILTGVIYANGDVALCELRPAVGNIREGGFWAAWRSEKAKKLRRSIKNRDCFCTNAVFMWPGIAFQPFQLLKCMVGARAWKKQK